MGNSVQNISQNYNHDKTRLMDILIDIQRINGFIPDEATGEIANLLGISRADVEQTLSFYHFFSKTPTGEVAIYLNDSVVANMMNREEVAKAFEEEAGCQFGSVSPDGKIGLFNTACIGMSDQEPAALVDNHVFTSLTADKARELIKNIKSGKSIEELVGLTGEGKNKHELVKAEVKNNIIKTGPILGEKHEIGSGISKCVNSTQEEIISVMKDSNLRGRGGAGFPTGMKWDFCRRASDPVKYIFCNADEGEPGTFKDRVLLTECPELVFEGMAIAAYAVGSNEGILYLRYEYWYLKEYLEEVLNDLRGKNILGKNIAGKQGFDFDIRIQFGAGAYVCGEESALIESAEGKRGEPRDRPPFPVEKGYMDKPTVVNNVETLCAAVKIIQKDANWYKSLGTKESTGTKVLSISGDCKKPGIYEIEWGFSINDIIKMVEASDVQAVQIAGPSGALIGPNEFDRVLGYEDLATGGSIIFFNSQRDLIKDVVLNFTEFFIDESCGSCTPCRAIPVFMKNKLEKIINGHGVRNDIVELLEWGKVMKLNRCGLGQTAANPIMTSLKNFRTIYDNKIQQGIEFDSGFDLAESVKESCEATGRRSNF